jgi:hypothetical protein
MATARQTFLRAWQHLAEYRAELCWRKSRDSPNLLTARHEGFMKHHLVTALLIIAALPLYAAGFAGGGTVALGAAIILEAWFWIRIVRGKLKQPGIKSG